MILRLPSHLCNDILIDWLALKDLGKLDLSYTCWKWRSEFLSLLSELRKIFILYKNINLLKWICIRSIKAASLSFRNHLLGKGNLPVKINTSGIRTVCISEVNFSLVSQDMNDFLLSCHSLKDLVFFRTDVHWLNPIVTKRLQKLTCLYGKL